MNTRVKSVPRFPGATRPSRRTALFALLGGGAVLTAAFGASVYSRSSGGEGVAPPAVSAPAPVANEPQQVYAFGSEAQAALVQQGADEANRLLSAAPAVSAPAPVANEGGGRALPVREQYVYVVASEAEAERAWAAINFGHGILASVGEQLPLVSVVVVPSGVQATEVIDAVAEDNGILATLGGPASVVVDLR